MVGMGPGFGIPLWCKDLMIQKIGNRATAEKANAAIEGPVGDAIAKLDLTNAHFLLQNIQQELTAIHAETKETNERTKQIQTSINDLRIEPGKIRDALVAADMQLLRTLDFSKVRPSVIEAMLRQVAPGEKTSVARQFFANSIDSSDAIAWLQSAITAGLNPNLRVAADYYEHESMLNEAARAGNVNAVKMLLRSGASPHAYQELHLTSSSTTRFVFPLQAIASDEHLRLQTKQELAKAFMAAGIVVPRVVIKGDSYMSVMYSAKEQLEQAGLALGLTVAPTPTLCEQASTPICKSASARSGVDWCAAIAAMPKKLTYTSYGAETPLYDLQLRYLLSIEGDDAYFLGFINSIGVDYVVVQLSRDAASWKVLKFMEPQYAMGLCRKDDDGYQPTACWREIDLVRQGMSNVMKAASWGVTWAIGRDPCAPDKTSSTSPREDGDVERSGYARRSAGAMGAVVTPLEEAQANH